MDNDSNSHHQNGKNRQSLVPLIKQYGNERSTLEEEKSHEANERDEVDRSDLDSKHSSDEQTAERLAIALEYDGNQAPFISATGSAATAEEIIALAKQYEIPIMENSELAHLLAKLELGDEIPEILYRTIAQIIAFVYMLQGKRPEETKSL